MSVISCRHLLLQKGLKNVERADEQKRGDRFFSKQSPWERLRCKWIFG